MKRMKSPILFKDIPCIKNQAYFIMVGLEGSWLWEATYPSCTDEAWCKNFVKQFIINYGDTVQQGDFFCKSNACVQEHIDNSYEDVIEYQFKKTLEKAVK